MGVSHFLLKRLPPGERLQYISLGSSPKAGIPQEEIAERAVAHGRPPGRQELDVLVRQERAMGHQALGG